MNNNFWDLLSENDSLIRLVGAHDGLSAKMIEEAGFDGIWSSGFGISTSHALPDASILGKESFLERAIEMRRSSDLPILQDLDTGYGGPSQLGYHVKDFEAAGINGVCIEDKIFPKTNSFVEGDQTLIGIEDFVDKIKSIQVNTSESFFTVARIEAFISGFGIDDAIYRADAYADYADAIVIHSKSKDGKDIREFLEKWDKKCCVIIIPTTYAEAFTEKEMKDLGVDFVIYANQLLRAMVYHGKLVLKDIFNNGIQKVNDIATMKELFELQGMDKFKALGK